MKVTEFGPNIPFVDGATFHVHAADCADLKRGVYPRIRKNGDQGGYTYEAESTLDIVSRIYDPDNFDYALADAESRAAYEQDIHIFPCVRLPLEVVTH